MTPLYLTMMYALLVLGLVGSALCSGMETGTYVLNRVRLHVLAHQGRRRAQILARLISNPTRVLVTLLIGNNIFNYAASASLALLMEGWGFSDSQTIIFNVLIVTPLLLVGSEILPKDMFAAYADRWVYLFVRPLYVLNRLATWTGVLPIITGIMNLGVRFFGTRGGTVFRARPLIGTVVSEGVGRGVLSDEQSAMIDRVLDLAHRTIAEEMTPWDQVIKVHLDDPPQALWDLANHTSRSRFPVVDDHGHVVGLVHIADALLHDRESCPPISKLMSKLETLRHDTPLRTALRKLQHHRRVLALVVEDNHPVGVITIKDLVEPITGELTSW